MFLKNFLPNNGKNEVSDIKSVDAKETVEAKKKIRNRIAKKSRDKKIGINNFKRLECVKVEERNNSLKELKISLTEQLEILLKKIMQNRNDLNNLQNTFKSLNKTSEILESLAEPVMSLNFSNSITSTYNHPQQMSSSYLELDNLFCNLIIPHSTNNDDDCTVNRFQELFFN